MKLSFGVCEGLQPHVIIFFYFTDWKQIIIYNNKVPYTHQKLF